MNFYVKIKFMRTSFILILGLIPTIVFAQFNLNNINISTPHALESELGVELIPTYPGPNQLVGVILTMYTEDLDSADIAWFENGKQVIIGRGIKQFSFITGEAGKKTEIEIRVRLQNGTIFTKKFSINPAGVDLLWEANTYTPPFYQGKALHSRQGQLKIVAMPNFQIDGKTLEPEKLIYEWSDGFEAYQSQSGYGRNVLILNGNILGKTQEIELFVRDPITNTSSNTSIEILPSDPEIIFYENDPFYGYNFEKALIQTIDMGKKEEVQVFASAFFFSKENGANIQYKWRLNGKNAPELENSKTVVFRRPEKEQGVANIKLEIENLNRVLQFANTNLNIKFDE